MSAGHQDNAPGFRAIRLDGGWVTRPVFGILLALFALFVVALPPGYLAVVLALGTLIAAREWQRCVGAAASQNFEILITFVSLVLAEIVLLYTGNFGYAALAVAAGAIASFVVARQEKHPLWQAAGLPYLALPALCLLTLQANAERGVLVVIGLLLIVWATDTGALICGKLIGGPRIAPRLSPGKTWAGTIGGSAIAALVYAGYIGFLGGAAMFAALFAFLFSFVAHGGDLFESYVKRRFGIKDSGAAIPGHGGVLDRMDSTLAAAPAMALLVFVAKFHPLFGLPA